jgi:hypothetical protein
VRFGFQLTAQTPPAHCASSEEDTVDGAGSEAWRALRPAFLETAEALALELEFFFIGSPLCDCGFRFGSSHNNSLIGRWGGGKHAVMRISPPGGQTSVDFWPLFVAKNASGAKGAHEGPGRRAAL